MHTKTASRVQAGQAEQASLRRSSHIEGNGAQACRASPLMGEFKPSQSQVFGPSCLGSNSWGISLYLSFLICQKGLSSWKGCSAPGDRNFPDSGLCCLLGT